MRLTVRLSLCLLVLVSCSSGVEPSILEQGPRVPDEEGVVTSVSFERIVLDGERTFLIHPDVESFTTRGHDPTSLLTWQDRYVHLGLNAEQEVIWVAGIGVVVQVEPPRVMYTGVFAGLDEEGRAVFEDGTVLRLDEGVEAVEEASETLVRIDPERRLVVELREQ